MTEETNEVTHEVSIHNRKKIYASISVGLVAMIMLIAVGFAMSNPTGQVTSTTNGASANNIATTNTGAVQIVQMTMQGNNYVLSSDRVKVNTPVKIVADMNSIHGCYTTVVIPEIGIKKTLSASDNTIEFTPTKTGTFAMTCGMGMAQGQIIVEDANGNAPAPVASSGAIKTSGGTCGASGGGCGCGG